MMEFITRNKKCCRDTGQAGCDTRVRATPLNIKWPDAVEVTLLDGG
jgi:hypothetical protein